MEAATTALRTLGFFIVCSLDGSRWTATFPRHNSARVVHVHCTEKHRDCVIVPDYGIAILSTILRACERATPSMSFQYGATRCERIPATLIDLLVHGILATKEEHARSAFHTPVDRFLLVELCVNGAAGPTRAFHAIVIAHVAFTLNRTVGIADVRFCFDAVSRG